MLSRADVRQQIREIIQNGMQAGQTMPGEWIATRVMSDYPVNNIPGQLGEFCTLACWSFIRDEVREVFGEYKAKPTPQEQLVLPGYKYLQQYYTIKRKGSPTFVPLTEMSPTEVLGKVEEYDRAIRGFTCHRDELMDWYRRTAEKQMA